MRLKNLKIGTQLIIGFAVMLFFVGGLGRIAFTQTNQLHLQTEEIYQHPLQVRRAIGGLNNDILSMRLGLRDLMLAKSDQEKQAAMQLMELSELDAEKMFNIIMERYLGPSSDVEEAYQAYIIWKSVREENIQLTLSGEIDQVRENLSSEQILGSAVEKLVSSINVIDKFAENKGNQLYANSVELHNKLNKQLVFLIIAILLLSLILCYRLLRNIRKPLKEIDEAIQKFHSGDMEARSSYEHKNEFGVLSSSFNTMADLIQVNTHIKEKSASLIEVMLREEDAKRFFQVTLGALIEHTGSQMVAVYLLSDDRKSYDHFESIGMDNSARKSFDADNFEGEFGVVLCTRKMQYIENIPDDTRFIFHSVQGKLIPRTMITIPILSRNQIIAIISLASISKYDEQSIAFIKSVTVTMSSRIEGILAYRRIKEFKEALEKQNHELDAHKSELSAQTVELIQQNTELEIQKKQLDDASRLKTNFLSNMSHELRTPLNSVIALSGVLSHRLSDQIPKEEYSYLEIIERNGKNLLLLINDILDISRIESGRVEFEITQFNAENLITEVVMMIQPQAKQKNIELIYETGINDLSIISDADKCRHILQNIIGNAVKFTEKGKVVISTQQSETNLEIKVSDSGIGISVDHLPHIFEEFRQADGSTSRRFGGTGLGLAIAKKYAHLLGGTILVKSIPDMGSEFTLLLPLRYMAENTIDEVEKTEYAKPEMKQSVGKPASIASDKTVLLVEDNEAAIIQIKGFVEGMGYGVLVAHDAVEAFAIIDQVMPDAMMLDLMMPGIDGFELLEILRNAEPTAHIPVLILTAKHITKEELRFLRRNNVHQLIQKGDVNRIELQNAVTKMLFPESVKEMKPQQKVQIIEGKPVVLVVEDNPDNMVTVKALLADQYSVIEATDGSEGIEMAKEYRPNLILMDIALSGIDGIEAFKVIRAVPELKHIPIIALTASAMIHDRETILSHGFDAFVAKPIIVKEFYAVINEVLYG